MHDMNDTLSSNMIYDENRISLISSDECSREEQAARTQMHEKQAGLSRPAGMRA
jgi:hypothetical protein